MSDAILDREALRAEAERAIRVFGSPQSNNRIRYIEVLAYGCLETIEALDAAEDDLTAARSEASQWRDGAERIEKERLGLIADNARLREVVARLAPLAWNAVYRHAIDNLGHQPTVARAKADEAVPEIKVEGR